MSGRTEYEPVRQGQAITAEYPLYSGVWPTPGEPFTRWSRAGSRTVETADWHRTPTGERRNPVRTPTLRRRVAGLGLGTVVLSGAMVGCSSGDSVSDSGSSTFTVWG